MYQEKVSKNLFKIKILINKEFHIYKDSGSWKENEVAGFTVAFLLFLVPAGGSNPAGLIA